MMKPTLKMVQIQQKIQEIRNIYNKGFRYLLNSKQSWLVNQRKIINVLVLTVDYLTIKATKAEKNFFLDNIHMRIN